MSIENIIKYLSLEKDRFDSNTFKELKLVKENAKKELNEELANKIWCLETISSIQKMYLNLFSRLKENKYDGYFEAWNLLERIDVAFSLLRRNCDYLSNDRDIFQLHFIGKIIKEYEKLFPYEYFTSRESIIKKQSCSICGHINTIRNHCEHQVGKLYMGEICYSNIEDIEFIGLAIVKNPLEKCTVIFPEGMQYDYSILENLMPNLRTPYDRWYVDILKTEDERYKGVGRNDKCPCGSDKKYKRCCLHIEKDMILHYRINLLDNNDIKPVSFKSCSLGIVK